MLVTGTREKQSVYQNDEDIISQLCESPVIDSIEEKKYYLQPDADLARAITGEQLLERLIPRIEQMFDK